MSAEARPDPRPRIAVRVGITGHRDVSSTYAGNSAAIESQIAVALAAIRDAAYATAAAVREGKAYRDEPPLLRMISPLAEGADRLAAEAGSRLGYRLLAPLPFAQAEYEKDFETEESKAEFRRLLARADAEEGTIALDGGRGKSTGDQSYYAVGRFVVRSVDVLIAVWQRDRPAGLGGTADIVTFALRTGVPVVWIPADAPAAMRLLAERDALELPMPSTADALADLAVHVQALLAPPAAISIDEAGPAGWRGLRERLRRLPYKAGSPLQQFYDERVRPSKGPMLAFDRFRRLFTLPDGGPQRRATVAPSYAVRQALTPPQLNKIAAYERIRDRADAVALFYSHCHRSTFLALFVLGAAALTCAGLAFAAEPGWLFVLLEIASLAAIGGLVAMDRIRRWHDRWIDYRILAELMRQMAYLVLLGRTLPINRAAILSTHGARTPRRQDWVLWYFSAVVREIGVPAARYEAEYLHSVRGRYVEGLLAEQIAFHELGAKRAGTVARRLGALGLLCFAGTFLAALCKIAVLALTVDQEAGSSAHRAIEALGVLGVALPALSAAAFALRAQAEFEIVAKNSERLHRRLQEVAERLTHLPLAGPLSTERLVEEIYGAGALMVADVEDWVALFDVKTVELS